MSVLDLGLIGGDKLAYSAAAGEVAPLDRLGGKLLSASPPPASTPTRLSIIPNYPELFMGHGIHDKWDLACLVSVVGRKVVRSSLPLRMSACAPRKCIYMTGSLLRTLFLVYQNLPFKFTYLSHLNQFARRITANLLMLYRPLENEHQSQP
jgi:hypothetical protein